MKYLECFKNLFLIFAIWFCLIFSAISYAQTANVTSKTIGYFYSASGTMVDAEDNNGAMSSYLTRGIRYNGTGETFAVSNIKDVTGLVDTSGNVLNKYTYTVYGVPTSYSSTSINSNLNTQNSTLSLSSNPYTYSNYYTDSESGNYYLNARYYDPTIGIFLTSDTYNLPNRNMYVNGNPVMGVDPTGHVLLDSENSFLCCIHWHYTKEQQDGPTTFHWGRYNHENDNAINENNKSANISHYSQNSINKQNVQQKEESQQNNIPKGILKENNHIALKKTVTFPNKPTVHLVDNFKDINKNLNLAADLQSSQNKLNEQLIENKIKKLKNNGYEVQTAVIIAALKDNPSVSEQDMKTVNWIEKIKGKNTTIILGPTYNALIKKYDLDTINYKFFKQS